MSAVAVGLVACAIAGCEASDKANQPGIDTGPWDRDGRPVAKSEPAVAAEPQVKAEPQQVGFWWPGDQSRQYQWVTMAYPTGDPRTSAIGIEKGVPREVRLNQPFEYLIRVTNLSSVTLEDVVVTDQLGSNFRLTDSDPDALDGGNGMYSWGIGSLGPREMRVIRVTGLATAEGMVTSCATVTYNSLLCSSITVVEPQLRLTKSGPAEVLRCDQFAYTYEVTNPGTGMLSDVKITDRLPNGLKTTDGNQTVNINVGQLAPGQTRAFRANVEAAQGGRFASMATATGGGGLEAKSDEVATMAYAPKLEITKTGPEMLFIGRDVTYEITVKNTGDGVARDAVIEDVVPRGAIFVSASDNGTLTGNTVRWNLGNLPAGGSRTVNVRFGTDQIGVIRNEAKAMAYCAEAVSATAQTDYQGIPAILLEVVDATDPIRVGDNVTYVITVTNQGSAVANRVKIICNLEDEMQFVSASGATTATATGSKIEFEPLGSLAAGAEATWRVVVKAVAVGDVRFKTAMTSSIITRPVEETESTNFYR
ncbi:MAG: DUF11 domain-containing protein [Planctomycetes bacterium]|nr:DUF11 domain-containing protein [Planctomycetota bacterium]